MATNNSNNTKTVTVVNYNDPVPGSTPLLQVLNSPGGNKYEIQINNGAGGFAATNSFVYSPVTGNVGLRGNLAVTGKISGKMTTSTQNLQIVGGTSGYVLSTDGTGNISWVDPMDGQYGNSNVANYLPTYNGDIGLDNITITGNTTAVNINATSITSNTLTSSENSYLYNVSATGLASLTTVTVGGNFTMNGGTANLGQASRVKITGGAADYFLQTDGTGNVTWAPIATSSTLQQVTTAGHTTNVAVQFTNSTQSINQTTGAVVVTGGIAAGGNVHGNHIHAASSMYAQQTVYSGQNSIGSSFTKPLFIGKDTGDEYVQAAMVNSNANGSADWAAYSDSGGDAQGWIDMGFTGTTFSDANYSITHPSDGYIFVEGMPAQGGNLILATGDLGNPTHRDIIFATGGFAEENEFARIDHANNQFKLTRSGSTLKFVDGTVFSGNEITTATTDSFSVTTSSLSSVSASCYIGLPNEFVADTEFNDDITVVQVGWTVIVDSVEYTVTYIDPAPPANQYRITVDGTAGFVSGSSYTFTNPVPVEHTWSIDQYGTITAPAGAEISQINDDFKIEVTGTDIIDLRTQGGDFILDAEGNININGPINSSTGVSRLDLTGGSVYLTSTDDDTTVLDMNTTKVEMYAGVDVNLTSGVLLPQLSTDYTDSTNVLELLFTENEGEVGYPWGITLPVSHITYNELILLEPDTFPNQAACTTQAYNTQNTWELWQDTIAQSKVRITSNELTWTFDSEGNLTLPSNTSSINYANGAPYGGGGGVGGNAFATQYEVAEFVANTAPGFGEIQFANFEGSNSAPATAQKLFINAGSLNEQQLGTVLQQWTTNSYRGTLSLNNGVGQATFNISNGGLYFEPEVYRGFSAGLNQIWGDDCSINQLIITNATAPKFYNTEFLLEDDVFHATNLATGNTHVMLNVYGSSEYQPIDPQYLWSLFTSFVDGVLYDGATLRTDPGDMKTQFYNNTGSFRNQIPTQDYYQYFTFSNSDYFGTAPTTSGVGGTDATLRIRVNPDGAYIVLGIATAGIGYTSGDNLFVAGTSLGGASPDNDLTLLIDSVDGGGGVTAVSYLSGTGVYPWPSNYISDGSDDQYDDGNYINTNLAAEISYGNGDTQIESAAFGGGDYCVMYNQSIFCMVATGSNINDLFYSGNLGSDGDGLLRWTGLRSNQNVTADNYAQYAYFDSEYLDGTLTIANGVTYDMTLDSAGINLDEYYAYYNNNNNDYYFGSKNTWRLESQNNLYVQSYNDMFIQTAINQRSTGVSGPNININASAGSPGQREINAQAGNGGSVNVNGGNAGGSDEIDSLGNNGGSVNINGGMGSGASSGGSVYINGGQTESPVGIAGNVDIGTFAGPNGNGRVSISTNNGTTHTWVFDDTGTLTAPSDITNQGNITTLGKITLGTGDIGAVISSNKNNVGFYDTITGITNGLSTVQVTLADVEFVEGDQGTVTIKDVQGEVEANGFWGWVAVDFDVIQLYTDATLSTPVDGTTWSAYTSGGIAISSGYNNLDIQGGNVAIISGSGQYWSFNPDGNLVLPSNNSSINYPNGNPYGGGGGSANTGNVTFNDQSVIGTGDQYGGSGLYLAPGTESVGNLQYLRVRGGDYPTHIHLDTGNYEYYDQYFGNDNKYLKLSAGANGNIIIGTDDTTGNLYNWTFDSDGNLTVPGNIKTINSGFTLSVPDITNVTGTNEAGVPGISGSQTFNAQLTYSPGINAVQVGWTVTGNNLVGTTTVTSVVENSPGFYEITTDTAETDPFWYNDVYTFTGTGYASWNFANTGYLTFPRDSAANTDPYLRIVGGTDPAIISEDASLAGPSNLDIVALNTIFSGFTGTEIRIYPDDGEIGSTANLQLWANAGSNVAQYSWTHDTTGSLILPTISTGEGTDEQSIVRSQRKIIPALHYSAAIDGTTPTVVYTASSNGINSLKITISMTHSALGQEMFDISAMAAGANVMYSVSNRLNGTGQPDTSVSVDYDGSNRLAITLTVNSGATTSWVTYDSTEFGFQVD